MAITGIIRPPPDIRVVADRTAEYVAKNGRGFESRIVNSAKGKTPKFAFLQPTSPFHAYYEERIQHFEHPPLTSEEDNNDNDNDDEKKKKKDDDDNDTKKKGTNTSKKTKSSAGTTEKDNKKKDVVKQKASVINPIAKAILGQRSKISDHLKKEREKRRTAAAATTLDDAKETTTTTPTDEDDDGDNNNATNNATKDDDEEEETTPALSLYNRISTENTNTFLPLPPPPFPLDTVYVVAPQNLTPTQLDTIQLVAQFVALDGKGGSFLPALCSREWSNRTYDFCQPRHIQFTYFSALVDAYRTIIQEHLVAVKVVADQKKKGNDDDDDAIKEKTTEEEKEKRVPPPPPSTKEVVHVVQYDVQAALDDAAYRTEYKRELERRQLKQQQNNSKDLVMEDGEIAYSIDWHQFVVVETLDFPIEEYVDVELSMKPTKMASEAVTTTEKKKKNETTPATATATTVSADDVDMEESSEENDGDDDDDDAEEEETIRVVPSYTPRVVGTFDPSTARAVDPLTGKSVSTKDLPEHMRIQLLDPRWAEERKKFQDKQKDSNLVGGEAVVDNIARFSSSAGGTDHHHHHNTRTNTTSTTPSSVPPPAPVGATTIANTTTGAATTSSIGGVPGMEQSTTTTTDTTRDGEPPLKKPRTTTLAAASDPRLPPSSSPPTPKFKVTIAPLPPAYQPPDFGHNNTGTPTSSDNNNTHTMMSMSSSSATASSSAMGHNTTTQQATIREGAADATTTVPPSSSSEEKILLSAADFIATLEAPLVELQVRLPNDPAHQEWNFLGQTVTLSQIDVNLTVKDVKGILSQSHLSGMPATKIQLKDLTTTTLEGSSGGRGGVFLSNTATLAALNIGPTALLELKMKQRGGRK